jgi:hypothetical protein
LKLYDKLLSSFAFNFNSAATAWKPPEALREHRRHFEKFANTLTDEAVDGMDVGELRRAMEELEQFAGRREHESFDELSDSRAGAMASSSHAPARGDGGGGDGGGGGGLSPGLAALLSQMSGLSPSEIEEVGLRNRVRRCKFKPMEPMLKAPGKKPLKLKY